MSARVTIPVSGGKRKMSPRTKAALMDVAKAAIQELTKEDDIETTIVRAMRLDGWRAFKMEYNFDQRKKLTLGEAGMTDHLFLRPHNQADPRGPVPYTKTRCYNPLCDVLWWEFKADKAVRKRAEMLSSQQIEWQAVARAQGFLVWSAGVDHEPTIAAAAKHYLDSGLARRRELFESLL